MKINLQPFCSTDEHRQNLHKPFSHGTSTFATDGRIIIEVNATEYPAEPFAPAGEKPAHGVTLAGIRQVGIWNHAVLTDWLPVPTPPPRLLASNATAPAN